MSTVATRQQVRKEGNVKGIDRCFERNMGNFTVIGPQTSNFQNGFMIFFQLS